MANLVVAVFDEGVFETGDAFKPPDGVDERLAQALFDGADGQESFDVVIEQGGDFSFASFAGGAGGAQRAAGALSEGGE